MTVADVATARKCRKPQKTMTKGEFMKKLKLIFTTTFMLLASLVFADTTKNELKLGHISVSGSVASYPNATVTGDSMIYAISVHVDKGSIITSGLGNPNYTDKLSNHKTGIWTFTNGIDANEAQTKVRALSFNYEDGMTITIDVNSNTINVPEGVTVTQFTPEVATKSDANGTAIEVDGTSVIAGSGGTPHYYMFVSTGHDYPWTDAYNKAKTYTFLGMKGYLATVTSAAEDGELDALTDNGGWAGAARIKTTTTSSLDQDTYGSINIGGASNDVCAWTWVCGPEAGYGIRTPSGVGGHTTGTPQAKAYVPYSKWLSQSSQPDGTGDSGEAYFQVHFGGNWNDLPVSLDSTREIIYGYFVEFSDYKEVSGYIQPASVAMVAGQVYDVTNGQDYSSIAEAIANANDGDVLQLMANQTVTDQGAGGKNLTIETSRFELSGSFAVTDGSITVNQGNGTVNLTSVKLSGGAFTLKGGDCASVSVTDGTFTVDGKVKIPSLALASGQKVTFGQDADLSSEITLTSSLSTGVITSGYKGITPGQVIKFPAGVTDYMLVKTKSGELKIKKHKSAW